MDPLAALGDSQPRQTDAAVTFEGQGRVGRPGATPDRARVRLEEASFEISIGGEPPILADYRDLTSIVAGPGSLLLVLGAGDDGVRVVLEQLGYGLGSLVGQLRERRTRQRLGDALVRLDPDPLPLLEYSLDQVRGVAQLAVHAWGAELVPLDESRSWQRLRRAAIGRVDLESSSGTVRVGLPGGILELPGLGPNAVAWSQRLSELRDGAFRDATTLVTGLVPDAPFAVRQRLGRLLVDGRPASTADLGPDLDRIDAAVLTEPVFAASFQELLRRGDPAVRWFAMAPTTPGTDERKAWYLVALPGNLLALELVSEGAHATYCFRVAPRAAYQGETPGQIVALHAQAATEISQALIDGRFLREPMALPADQLANARYLRYRLALAALPTLAAARQRFVARLVHDDPARWAGALDALIAWHGGVRDESAEWPGRANEDAAVSAAGDQEREEVPSDAGL